MFTGIVQTTGRVTRLTPQPAGVRLTIDTGGWSPQGGRPPELGDSICVSGVCLTVAKIDASTLGFDVIPQTLGLTTLGTLGPGDAVNLEPAVTPMQPLGGHFMQGHVDGVGRVTHILDTASEWRMTIEPPPELMPFMIAKGSVAIDGVSLTLAAVHDSTFEVALIPTTLKLTTLGQRTVGDAVNLEADILTKTTVATLQRMAQAKPNTAQPVTMDLLRSAGFA